MHIVSGGPRLLRSGRPSINAFAEGFHWPENPEFFHASASDATRGRSPASRHPAACLGTRDALNLDGGGSTGMTIGDELVTRPSDPTGERPIADAILIGR